MLFLNLLLVALIAAFLVLLFWNIEARYYIESPCVKFYGDRNLDINLYPGDFESVFLFSVDDLSWETEADDLQNILDLLKKHKVKGTFFTIPLFKGLNSPLLSEHISKITLDGHEVAQHGLTHTRSRYHWVPYLSTFEFKGLDIEEQKERIRSGKVLLESYGVSITGFRTPHFSSNTSTIGLLIKEGFSYLSDVRIRPEGKITNKRYLGVVYGSIYYPYYWEDFKGQILIIPANGDYAWDLGKAMKKPDLFLAKKRFNRYYDNHGVFCLLTHLHPLALSRSGGLKFIDSFLKHVGEEDIWKPTMTEFAAWWKARCNLEVQITDGQMLRINLKLPRGMKMENLKLDIKSQKNYKIVFNGRTLKEGKGIESVYLKI